MLKPAKLEEHIIAPYIILKSRPPLLTKTNVKIARRNRTTVVIKATNKYMQASKVAITLSLKEIIYEEKQESSRLRQELDYEHRIRIKGNKLKEEVSFILN
jgi:hypothetical protein